MTGEDAIDYIFNRKVSSSGDIFQGLDTISGPTVEAFLLQNMTKTVLLLDEFMQVILSTSYFRLPLLTMIHDRFICTRIRQTTRPISKQLPLPSISPSAQVA